MIIAKFNVAYPSMDNAGVQFDSNGNSEIHIAVCANGQFRVYVNGGALLDGRDEAYFNKLSDARQFVFDMLEEILDELADELHL
jgi:hypothetical protein